MKKGVYAVSLLDGLTSLQADEFEYLLIRKIKQSMPCFLYLLLVGNVNEGHSIPRIEAMTREQLDVETNQIYEEAMQKTEDLTRNNSLRRKTSR
jgi:hypothetical protein